MASLIGRAAEFDIATGNDADADRHGIVTPDAGLMNPNHYLAVAIQYLYANRPNWRADAVIGKTLVSSSIIDRVALDLGFDERLEVFGLLRQPRRRLAHRGFPFRLPPR